jgi:hypothetical protein
METRRTLIVIGKVLAFLSGVACALSVKRWLDDAGRAEHQQGQRFWGDEDDRGY